MTTSNTELSHSWKLNSIKIKNDHSLQNVIFRVYWTITGTDSDGYSSSFTGSIPLNPPDANTFISFDRVQENDVIKWIKDKVYTQNSCIDNINQIIINDINLKKQSVIHIREDDFPWANTTNTDV